jgi:carbonic anhydrase/acetyltransferase-like protein (isoleucine patch superfamily)
VITNYLVHHPIVPTSAFVAENASLVGKVTLGEDVNVWYGAVIRGDVNSVTIGGRTNVQDNVTIHVADQFACIIGEGVTIGHGAIVHACTIEENVLIGMGSIILDGAHVEKNVIIGAGALVPPGKRIPAGSLVVGSPAKIVRQLTEEEIAALIHSAEKYVSLSKSYKLNE